MAKKIDNTFDSHIKNVIKGNLRYENVFQSITRMILGDKSMIEKVNVNGKTTYDFKVFRQGKKHIIGMYYKI